MKTFARSALFALALAACALAVAQPINLARPVLGTLGTANGGTGLSTFTRSGNTTSFATTTGALTSTYGACWDASGNLVSCGGAPLLSSGILAAANGGTGLSAFTRSGNTTTFATTTGTLTSGYGACFDASGNLVSCGGTPLLVGYATVACEGSSATQQGTINLKFSASGTSGVACANNSGTSSTDVTVTVTPAGIGAAQSTSGRVTLAGPTAARTWTGPDAAATLVTSGGTMTTAAYTIPGCTGNSSPVNNNTYFFGCGGIAIQTNTASGVMRIPVPFSGTITKACAIVGVSGTAGTGTNNQLYVRVTNTTDLTVSSSFTAGSGATYICSGTLSTAVVGGTDYLEWKWIAQTSGTAPTGVTVQGLVIIQ